MRVAVCLLTLAFLAACSDSGLPPLPTDQVRVRFPPGGVVDTIEVDAVDRLPLRSAELIAPDGVATPASYLNVNPSPTVDYYQRSNNGPYANSTLRVGNSVSEALFSTEIGGAPQSSAQLLAMISTASIPLPDPVEYRRDWRSYRIFLSFGDSPGEIERRVLAAPEPPPGG